jgi:hypothetical protein
MGYSGSRPRRGAALLRCLPALTRGKRSHAMVEETLCEEHARLLRETEALRQDHVALESGHSDQAAHRAHRLRLQKQIDALHEHIDRIKREVPTAFTGRGGPESEII